MLEVTGFGELSRTVTYEYRTQEHVLKDTIAYSPAEAAKPVQQKPVTDDEGNFVYDAEGKKQMRSETVPEWVERVTNGIKMFSRDGNQYSALEASKKYDDLAGLLSTIFKAIQENEQKN